MDLTGRLGTSEDIQRFIEGGNATFTIRNPATGTRFTYRARRPDDAQPGKERPIWMSLMNGPDNEDSFQFIGTTWPANPGLTPIRQSKKSKVSTEAPSFRALEWVLRNLLSQAHMDKIEVWHEGRCGRCGRKLTVPESVQRGFGPECSSILGI